MKTFSLNITWKLWITSFIIIISTTFMNAQLHDDLRNEILIYIEPSALEFPDNEQGNIPIGKLNILSSDLREVLNRFKINNMQKAFPNYTDADTLATREDGAIVKLSKVSRIFIICMPQLNDVDSAISYLSKVPGILFAEKHSDMKLHNDDYYSNQWHLNNTGQTGGIVDSDIDAPEA